MSYEIQYDTTQQDDEDARAIVDTKNYLGDSWERFLCAVTVAVAQRASRNQIGFVSSFAGVQGYPVDAVIRLVCSLTNQPVPEWDEDQE